MKKDKSKKAKGKSENLGPGLRFDFAPQHPKLAIGELIMKHQGAEQAITIEGIANELWPTEWWFIKNDSTGHPTYPYRPVLQRSIKQWVSNLVRFENKLIVSSRGSRPGYFAPRTKEEIDRATRTYVRQATQMLQRARTISGKPEYAEMAGQLLLLAGVREKADR